MPTYDYRCKACGHTFELYQTMSEPEKRKCPECAKNSLERLIGAGAALIFKGSGYYLTDYRSKSYEEGARAERDASKPAEPSAESKTPESKPDTKAEAKADKDSAPKAPAKSAAKAAPKAASKPAPKGSGPTKKPKGK